MFVFSLTGHIKIKGRFLQCADLQSGTLRNNQTALIVTRMGLLYL